MLNSAGEVVGIAASTESLYYTDKDGEQKNLQMVFKNCVPVSQLRELISECGSLSLVSIRDPNIFNKCLHLGRWRAGELGNYYRYSKVE